MQGHMAAHKGPVQLPGGGVSSSSSSVEGQDGGSKGGQCRPQPGRRSRRVQGARF